MARIVKDWTKFIVPRVNDNNQPDGDKGNKSFRTTDTISIRSWDEVKNQTNDEKLRSSTDFALMNFNAQGWHCRTLTGKRACSSWLRSAFSLFSVDCVYYNGSREWYNVGEKVIGVCPSLDLYLPSKISASSASHDIGEVRDVKSQDGKTLYYTIDIGEYPKTRVPNYLKKN